jgi:beta-lactamase regulating signal transducer with metallopeptidase domain
MMDTATLATLSSLLLDGVLRATVILGVALGVTFLLRQRSAALRHLVLSLAIAGALLTPVMTLIAPAWRPAVVDRVMRSVQTTSAGAQASLDAPGAVPRAAEVTTTESLRLPPGDTARARNTNSANVAGIIMPIWIAGMFVCAGILLTGLARLRWLASRSRRVPNDEPLAALVEEIALARGVSRPIALLRNDRTRLLVTWGHFRPRVMLPAAAARWSDERLRIVISHELAHVRRGDWVTQLAAELLRAVFWFNPLVWIACRRLRAESELACDDEVLNGGIEGVDYAGHLLELARVLNSPRHAWLSAPAMARPSSLEGRISAMLNAGLNRHPVTRAARAVACALVLGLTLAVAGFAQSTFYTFSGTVVDSTDRVAPGAELTLTNPTSGARYAIKSDKSGRFEFVGLPSADYGLEVQLMGFKAFKETIAIASSNVTNHRIALQLGQVKEAINVTGAAPVGATPRRVEPVTAPPAAWTLPSNCKASETNTGGEIKPPTKIRHVPPIYPPELNAANIGGIVSMEALIDTQGNVQDVTVLTAPDPGLATAATESVMQWKYTPTLLNCAPTEVRMGVTVSFVPKQQQ